MRPDKTAETKLTNHVEIALNTLIDFIYMKRCLSTYNFIVHTIIILISLSLPLVSCNDNSGYNSDRHLSEYVAEGKVLYMQGDYNSALTTLQKVLSTVQHNEDSNFSPSELQNTYLLLGNIHFAFGDYVRANEYYITALDHARQTNDYENELILLNDLAIVACYAGNRDDAMKYNEQLKVLPNVDKKRQQYFHLITSAYIEQTFGNPARAMQTMKDALSFIDTNHLDPTMRLSPLSEISDYYERNNQLDSAIYYLKIYETQANELNAPDMVADNMRKFMRVYTKMGNNELALKYQEDYFTHIDSLMNPNRFINLSNRFQQDNLSKTNQIVSELRQTVANQKIMIILIIFIIIFVTTVIIYRNKTKKVNIQLFKRNKEIAEIENKVRAIEYSYFTEHSNTSSTVADTDETSNHDEDYSIDHEQKMKLLFEKILLLMNTGTPYCDPEFSLSKLADDVDSNTRYVSQVINDFTGKNFRTFINEYRIREARRRLLDIDNYGNVTMQYLANSVGFLSTSTFNMAFKKFTGMTPSLYQQLGKDNDNK